jgi:WD40 repeat protein
MTTQTKLTHATVLSPDGRTFLTIVTEGPIRLWKISDLAKARPEPVAVLPPEPIYGGMKTEPLRFGPDGKSLAVTNTKDGVQLWDLTAPARPVALSLLSRNDIPGERVDSAILGPDKRILITTSYDDGVYLWRVSQ